VPDAAHRSQFAFYRSATADRAGHFVIHDIPPGEYLMFAWDQVERDAYLDPDFLRQFEDLGQSVRVNEGDHQDVRLPLIPSDPDAAQ
jgi:hypothetical protein